MWPAVANLWRATAYLHAKTGRRAPAPSSSCPAYRHARKFPPERRRGRSGLGKSLNGVSSVFSGHFLIFVSSLLRIKYAGNQVGKEAVIGILGPADFFGEGCLAGQRVRMGTATAIAPTAILVIEKDEMMRVLRSEHALSDRFMSYILSRNIRIEEDLIDQLFNSSEKRLARTLLLLSRYGSKSE